jgi:hypothetical protein
MNLIDKIVALYHRIVGATVAEVSALEIKLSDTVLDTTKALVAEIGRAETNLHTRIDCLETYLNPVVLELRTAVSELHVEIIKHQAELKADNAEAVRLRDDAERRIEMLDANLVYKYKEIGEELERHLEALRHLDMSKRESPNVIGSKPALLK